MLIRYFTVSVFAGVLSLSSLSGCGGDDESLDVVKTFNRVATFPVCKQLDPDCDVDTETSAEIIAASEDGLTLIYTDSPNRAIGFVDISNPSLPQASGSMVLTGEPTSIAVKENFALVAVNTSSDFIDVSGQLVVINIQTQQIITTLELDGQPDSIAVSPDKTFATVVIENERDEDLDEGIPPQLPAGELVIVNIQNESPNQWALQRVDLTGLADLYSGDPEPEYVDINTNNIAVVTLQENNHIVLIDLATGNVVNEFGAGSVDLFDVDLTEEKPNKILLSEASLQVLREPDGVSWINDRYFATANEGDLEGGSRGFSVFNLDGDVVWDSGNSLDHLAVRFGHYPDKRSGNKGNEPENIEFGIFENTPFVFVNSERANLVFVYDVSDPEQPEYRQTLPAAVAPEGGLAIPTRNLLVVASESDARGDKIRSAINIYRYDEQNESYPSLTSVDDNNTKPISWGAFSALTVSTSDENTFYTIDDSFYASNKIFTIDNSASPARITQAITITDENDILLNFADLSSIETDNIFDAVDLSAMINADKSVNIDAEGIDLATDGGFWVASEGAGTIGNTQERPIEKLNFIFKISMQGVIEDVITLPTEVNDIQVRFGFEGIAEYNDKLYVTFQREWGDELNPRIGIYDTLNRSWEFVQYPLDEVLSPNGGWVGLSDIASLDDGSFLILERDNQGGPDARIKKIYSIDLTSAQPDTVVNKTFVLNLIPALKATNALVYEKVEGLAVTQTGQLFIINDNDGVDDNSGETQLLNVGNL